MWTVALLILGLQQSDSSMVPAYVHACIQKAVAGRAPEQLDAAARQRYRQELLGMLGLDPAVTGLEKTPLNAQVTGRLQRDGYVIEKIVYETFPQFYATAYLYLPAAGKAPYPVVVSPVGHWSRKKLEPVVQARCIGLALHGFAVLCIDMPGFVGPNNDERNFPGDHCDWLLHMCSLPPAGVMVWDIVRGLDYLETRPDIDVQRVGLTGESGGGLTTMYAGVVDTRVRCYAPVCYAVSYADNCNNGCFCNHVPGAMVIGDRSDVMALAAPKPILLIGAENDPEFPKAGTLRSHQKLTAHYAAAGAAGDCKVFVAPGGHDYSKPMRERMYGFMLKHLVGEGDGSPALEPRELTAGAGQPAVHVEDPADPAMLCFPGGKAPPDARTLRQWALERGNRLIADSRKRTEGLSPQQLRTQLRSSLLRIYPLPEPVPLDVRFEAAPAEANVTIGAFACEPGLRIPFRLRRGGPAVSSPVKLPVRIIFSDQGMDDPLAVTAASASPHLELRIDGRGLGRIPGLEMKYAVYLGRPDVWMWACDVSRAVDYVLTLPEADAANIEVWGFGPAGGQVAYLAALLDPRIARAFGERTLRSYLDAFDREGLPRFAMPHRILEVGDLPLMRKAVAGGQ